MITKNPVTVRIIRGILWQEINMSRIQARPWKILTRERVYSEMGSLKMNNCRK